MRQYTAQQIREAIKRWEAVLKRMDEAQTAVLNALEKEFGDAMYNYAAEFLPIPDIMNRVFDILNKSLFSNQLPKTEVLCMSTEQMQDFFNKKNHSRDASKLYAVYLPDVDLSKINFVKKNQMPANNYLIINISNCSKGTTFSFAVNALCHEMIHFLDTIKGDVLLQAKIKYDQGKMQLFDEHSTELFMKKQKQFNKEGLTIIPDDGGFDQQTLNNFSVERAIRLREMEEILLNPPKSKSHMVVSELENGHVLISF